MFEKFNWTEKIKIHILMLRLMGLWPTNHHRNLYAIYTIFTTVILMGSFNVVQVINIRFVYNDLEALSQTIVIATTDALTSVKIYFFLRNFNILEELIMDLNSDVFQPRNKEHVRLVTVGLNFWKTVSGIFYCMGATSVLSWMVRPFVDGGFRNGQLPCVAWYPYDYTISPYYELTFLHQVICNIYFAVCIVFMDTLIAAFMMYVWVQCEILSDNLKNLHNFKFGDKFVDCVTHHRAIIRFATNCNTFFNMIVLVQFFISLVAIAVSMFQLSLVEPFSSTAATHIAYVSAITAQCYLYCWFGNEVALKSSQIPYSAFESDWTGIPIEAKKNLLIFIMRAQKPIKMSAINLFSLSLATFTTILRTSWSYFAVLRQVNAQD